jgi:hypothetical protein
MIDYIYDIEHIKSKDNFTDILSRAFKIASIADKNLKTPDKEDKLNIIKDYHLLTSHRGAYNIKYHVVYKYLAKGINRMINDLFLVVRFAKENQA